MTKRSLDQSNSDIPLLLEELQDVLPTALLTPPHLNWSDVDPLCLRFLCKVAGSPWTNPLALAIAVGMTYVQLKRSTVVGRMYLFHKRWQMLFPHFHLTTFDEWDPVEHIPKYLHSTECTDSSATRQSFLEAYYTYGNHIQMYLRSLSPTERDLYRQWAWPLLPRDLFRCLSRKGEILDELFQNRKGETDALVPHYARMRSEAHLRWNALWRLQTQFREAIVHIDSGLEKLPLKFTYEEPHLDQRLHFILWDRSSYVLAHALGYGKTAVRDATKKIGPYSTERNHYFLEFLGAEALSDPSSGLHPDELLWFGDLLRYDLLGKGPSCGTEEEVKRKQAYLKSWGYEATEGEHSSPFETGSVGLLSQAHIGGAEKFLSEAQKRTEGILLQVEPLMAAATFGLAALDIITTTGARMNELLQISLTPECLHSLEIEGTRRLLLRLFPKDRDKPADYFVGTETRRNLEKAARLLQEHYHLQADTSIPQVHFNTQNSRHYQFLDTRPYLFQFSGKHLVHYAITACMRFLCHAMVFQTAEGRPVVLKAHLLRHVFASHIHHVEQVPLDIVAFMLHQKDIRVTQYYAAPPWQQILTSADALLDHFATQLGDLGEAFVRAPAELQQQLEEAKQQVGTLAKVRGGECTCHAICPISFACTGCVFKVPDPSRRNEVIEQKNGALIRLEQVTKRKLGPEVVKMRALIRRCNVELEEMEMIEQYRKDEQIETALHIQH